MCRVLSLFLGSVDIKNNIVLHYPYPHAIICFWCTSCRSGTRQVKSVSGEAWWSTTTAAFMLSSLCTTWPASPPSRAFLSGLRSAADTLWGPWCHVSWWATSVIWGTAGRSPPRLRSVLQTATISHYLRLQLRTLPRRNMLTLSSWPWLIDWRATNPWDWSSWARAASGSCGTGENRKQQFVNAEVTSILYESTLIVYEGHHSLCSSAAESNQGKHWDWIQKGLSWSCDRKGLPGLHGLPFFLPDVRHR